MKNLKYYIKKLKSANSILAIIAIVIIIIISITLLPVIVSSNWSPAPYNHITKVYAKETGLPKNTKWEISFYSYNLNKYYNFTSNIQYMNFTMHGGNYEFWVFTVNNTNYAITSPGYNEGGYNINGNYLNTTWQFGYFGLGTNNYLFHLLIIPIICGILIIIAMKYLMREEKK